MADITFEGTLGSDPELRFSPSGTAVTNFSVAESYKKGDERLTSWFRCVAFNDMAETICESLRKGQRIIVQGRMQEETYEKDGEERKSWSVLVNNAGASLRWQTAEVVKVERES